MKDTVHPQLTRKCYSIDSDDDSEDSLEILLPTSDDGKATLISHAKKPTRNTSSFAQIMNELSDDTESSNNEDENEEVLFNTAQPNLVKSKTSNSSNIMRKRLVAKKRPLSRITTEWSSSSSSSSAVDIVTTTTSAVAATSLSKARTRREEERIRKKVETDRRKRQDQRIRQIQKDREKQERKRRKELEKETKQQEKLETKQASGKFAHEEIVILVDPVITRSNEYGIVTCVEEDFTIKEYPSPFSYKKTIQWIRKDYLEGGADDAWKCLSEGKQDQLVHIEYLVVILDYFDFIPLIERIEHDVDDDYPNLGRWFTSLKNEWKQAWSAAKEPRVTLLLNRVAEDLDCQWNTRQRKDKDTYGTALPSDWELRDSLQWLLIQFQVDCIHCTSNEEIQVHIQNFTRVVAEAPYSNQATELECIRKIKPAANLGDDPLLKVQDTWARQLQMIPKVSEARARNLVQHYPTMLSLWQAYEVGDESTNCNLLNHCFGTKTSQASLSATIYKVMTCKDPKEMV